MVFVDRRAAGRGLARRLTYLRALDPIVLGLPRGGVPVAYEVATALHAELDVLVVRKLGVPWRPEVAMGAVGEDGVTVLNDGVLRVCGIARDDLAAIRERALAHVARGVARYRGDLPRRPLSGRFVIVVDDGIATGATARVACRVVRAQGAAHVVLAVPVLPADAVLPLHSEADGVVWVIAAQHLESVGNWYADFSQTDDDEVRTLLAAANRAPSET